MTLDKKTLELVAIGASVAIYCESSQEKHVNAAREAGATVSEIQDSINMGKQVRQEFDDIVKRIRKKVNNE